MAAPEQNASGALASGNASEQGQAREDSDSAASKSRMV